MTADAIETRRRAQFMIKFNESIHVFLLMFWVHYSKLILIAAAAAKGAKVRLKIPQPNNNIRWP